MGARFAHEPFDDPSLITSTWSLHTAAHVYSANHPCPIWNH
jgi:hypothetical protein